ncbi:hypothetical protein EBME_0732 [bacterium endosymbiont of Mortierella elongata FMR23-6]|nr:hypothetical protein EBME_0732 [bacterium endosymbiont of Mortierella elongata FMR23-6]
MPLWRILCESRPALRMVLNRGHSQSVERRLLDETAYRD